MSDTYLAVFVGSKTSAKMAAWNALPEAERRAKEKEGIAAWKAWVEKHQGAILEMGGPLGKTKRVDARGIGKGEAGRALFRNQAKRCLHQRLFQIAVVVAALGAALFLAPAHVKGFYMSRPKSH